MTSRFGRYRWTIVRVVGSTILVVGVLGAVGIGSAVCASECTVPGDHGTLQDAVGDYSCDPINLVDQVYVESVRLERSVGLVGPPQVAEIAGRVTVVGPGILVRLENVKVDNGCAPESLSAAAGGRIEGQGLEVVRTSGGPCPPVSVDLLFADGFESGDTTSWTGSVPRPALTLRAYPE